MLNKNLFSSKGLWLLTVFLICAIGVLLLGQSPSVVAGEKAKSKNLDRMKAVEQILRAVVQPLKEAKEIGVLNLDVPVQHLQPYCRDWDVHPASTLEAL